jgi:DNA (cytosine-5)-methyltransferase 1
MSNRPRLLDLFSGAGGAAMGYYRAGFDVVGVDIKPQPRYPFTFVQGDALEYCAAHGYEFDVIHASPPCQAYSVTKSIHNNDHPALVDATRDVLIATSKIYVIENVVGAPLRNPLMLCGSMFAGLRVYRHRLFECNPQLFMAPATCHHSFKMPASKGQYHELNGDNFITCVGHNFKAEDGRIAMGIDWMTRAELSQAIPPAYTEYIGGQLLQHMEVLP